MCICVFLITNTILLRTHLRLGFRKRIQFYFKPNISETNPRYFGYQPENCLLNLFQQNPDQKPRVAASVVGLLRMPIQSLLGPGSVAQSVARLTYEL